MSYPTEDERVHVAIATVRTYLTYADGRGPVPAAVRPAMEQLASFAQDALETRALVNAEIAPLTESDEHVNVDGFWRRRGDVNERVAELVADLEALDARFPGHVRELIGAERSDRLLAALVPAAPIDHDQLVDAFHESAILEDSSGEFACTPNYGEAEAMAQVAERALGVHARNGTAMPVSGGLVVDRQTLAEAIRGQAPNRAQVGGKTVTPEDAAWVASQFAFPTAPVHEVPYEMPSLLGDEPPESEDA